MHQEGSQADLKPERVLTELHELQELTGNSEGAQRVCWTDTWKRAREWMRRKLSAVAVDIEVDAAGNQWATLQGHSPRALLIGGHIDSVPNGGWLDGCLNLVAGLEVLRRFAGEGEPPFTVRLVDWADEEGARFGRSLLGSSAASGTLDIEEVLRLQDRDGIPLPRALAQHGVQLDRMKDAHRQLENAGAYIELHIEQGPVLERLGLPLAAVLGTCGVERHVVRFHGQAAHSGSTPMDDRHDALAAAARLILAVREPALRAGGVATAGWISAQPGIPTAVPGRCEITLDQRHLDLSALGQLLAEAKDASERIAEEERVGVEWERIWRIDPIHFTPELIDLADDVIREIVGTSHRMPSGPLHDAAEVARAHVPTVMMFVQSLRGLSHTGEEDTKPEHIELAVRAFDRLATRTMGWLQSREEGLT
jgi:N-carbamoyl-L-amino-acid hydrolase